MKITMTIGDVVCKAQVLQNELTCRIPKGLVVPSNGLPVRVRIICLSHPKSLMEIPI